MCRELHSIQYHVTTGAAALQHSFWPFAFSVLKQNYSNLAEEQTLCLSSTWLQLEMCQTAFSLPSRSIKVCMSHLTTLTFICELVQTDRAIREAVNGALFDHVVWDGISEKRYEEQDWPEVGSQVSQLGSSEIWGCGHHKAVAEIWACGFNGKCYAALYGYLPQWGE